MTKEDEQLLLIDICGRLPYKVIGAIAHYDKNGYHRDKIGMIGTLEGINYRNEITFRYLLSSYNSVHFTYVKPLLRPISSMTEEEKEEYLNIDNRSYSCPIDYAHIPASERIDWLNRKMFDFRGLIPKDLAISTTEVFNPYED